MCRARGRSAGLSKHGNDKMISYLPLCVKCFCHISLFCQEAASFSLHIPFSSVKVSFLFVFLLLRPRSRSFCVRLLRQRFLFYTFCLDVPHGKPFLRQILRKFIPIFSISVCLISFARCILYIIARRNKPAPIFTALCWSALFYTYIDTASCLAVPPRFSLCPHRFYPSLFSPGA